MIRNSDLLRRIADAIEAEPERYDQDEWIKGSNNPAGLTEALYEGALEECGTTACVAGWAIHLSRNEEAPKALRRSPHDVAAKLLDITDKDADILFNATWKPRADLTAPEALRFYADGDDLEEVSVWL